MCLKLERGQFVSGLFRSCFASRKVVVLIKGNAARVKLNCENVKPKISIEKNSFLNVP